MKIKILLLLAAICSMAAKVNCQVSTADNAPDFSTDYVGWESGTTHELAIRHEDNYPIEFYTNDIFRMILDSLGRLGHNIEIPITEFQVEDGTVIFTGDNGTVFNSFADIPDGETVFLWSAPQGAFRAGVFSDEWFADELGAGSASFGTANTTIGIYSITAGFDNYVSGASNKSPKQNQAR